jgi:endonuclease YncB( thermonuclease family)
MGAIVFLLLLVAAPSQSQARPIYGSLEVVDGDTLRMGGARIRLFGIDAPERDQICSRNGVRWLCGSEATEHLKRLVTGKSVRCIPTGKDGYGRTLARCDTIGVDLNKAMVESGYAIAFRKYSTDYVSTEETAKAGARGLWSGAFEEPSVYRANGRARATRASPMAVRGPARARAVGGDVGCTIKGIRSRRGEWIYHLPGMPYYDRTRAEEIFCSEADAQAAGYRRAQGGRGMRASVPELLRCRGLGFSGIGQAREFIFLQENS